MCQLVRVGITLKQEELDDLYGCILDCQVQEALAHHVKTVKHLAAAALKLHLEHLVHLDELFRLVVLDELYEKARSLDDTFLGSIMFYTYLDEQELLVLHIHNAVQVCF